LRSSAFALDRDAFTFTSYNLDVRIEPEQQRLAVRGTVTLRNDSATAQKDASLQISSSLDWRSIHLNGKPVQFVSQPYTSDLDHTGALSEAIVSLPMPVAPQASVELEIGYEGTIPLDTTRLTRIGVPLAIAKHSDWDQIGKDFTAVRGIGHVAWYPIATEAVSLSEGTSVFREVGRWKEREAAAAMKMHLRDSGESAAGAPGVLCNGHNSGLTDAETGREQLAGDDCSFSPLGNEVPLFLIGQYSVLDSPAEQIHYFSEHKQSADTLASSATKIAPFVADWFGAPRHKAVIADLEDSDAATFESGNIFLSALDNVEPRLAEMTAVHQLTHASFPSPREWIYEGLAHFAQAIYEEHQGGREAALKSMMLQLGPVLKTEKDIAGEKGADGGRDSLINTPLEELYRSKAMYVWWMLRDMVGGTALKQALRAYQPEQDRAPSYMQHLIEQTSHRDLEWFFDDWVYRDHGLPDFHVESVYSRKMLPKGYMVTVSVENLGAAGAEVPVTVKTEMGELSKRLTVPGNAKASIRIETEALPEEVTVNDGSVPESDTGNDAVATPAPVR
jgi:hypothetical protein